MQSTALLINETFSLIKHKKAYSLLICAGLKQKNTEYLNKYFDKLEWNNKNVYMFEGIVEALTEAMAVMPYEEIFLKAAQTIYRHHSLYTDYFIPAIKKWEEKDTEDLCRLMHVLSLIDGTDMFLRYARIRAADFENMPEKLPGLYDGYFANTNNMFILSQCMLEIAQRHNISLCECYERVPFEKWKAHLNKNMSGARTESLSVLQEFMNSIFPEESARHQYFEICMAEMVILHTKFDDYNDCRGLLREFARITLRFNRRYYKDEVFISYRELLPPQVQAAYWLEQAFLTETDDREQYKEALKKCAEVYPAFALAVKALIRLYGEEQMKKQQQARKAKAEMRELAIQIKNKVQELMDAALYQEALEVLEQLKVLRPDDLEVISLRLKIRLGQLKTNAI